jgi:dipeptidyl aminopeptidase/acylaminoacyl peptidase
VAQKLADPARIAIVGASYGGYAALMGAVKEPDLYHCAVAIAPVTDLELLIERINNSIFGDAHIPRIGSDSAVLEKTSPARNVDRIHIPLLLVHGRKDYTVPVAHTEKMAEALKKAGKPVEVIYLDEADHFLSHGDDRLTALKALEKFLTSNLTP